LIDVFFFKEIYLPKKKGLPPPAGQLTFKKANAWKAKCPILEPIVAGFRGKVA